MGRASRVNLSRGVTMGLVMGAVAFWPLSSYDTKSFGALQNGWANLETQDTAMSDESILQNEQQRQLQMHLFSLKWSSSKDPSAFSKVVKDTWKWKDEVLGDGRDFFIPRINTLKKLQCMLQPNLEECVILSNCARFEILVVTNSSHAALSSISRLLVAQLVLRKGMTLPVDWPGNLVDSVKLDKQHQGLAEELADTRHWAILKGTRDVTRHLCLVAAGMAPRPSRPGRPVEFRPFSSRDAHIMLQLKRTLDISESSKISLILRNSLHAGKAVRNPDQVPDIALLRRYGTGNSKYDSNPPAHLVERVTKAAQETVIDPLVEECAESMNALECGELITEMRQAAFRLARNNEERQWIQRQLHKPTMQLRKSQELDRAAMLSTLEKGLQGYRSNDSGL